MILKGKRFILEFSDYIDVYFVVNSVFHERNFLFMSGKYHVGTNHPKAWMGDTLDDQLLIQLLVQRVVSYSS